MNNMETIMTINEVKKQACLVLLGNSGVGKDTIANLLVKCLENDGHDVVIGKMADYVKDLFILLPTVQHWWLEDKVARTTKGIELCTRYSSQITLHHLLAATFESPTFRELARDKFNYFDLNCEECDLVIATDIRTPEEAQHLVDNYEPIVISLERSDVEPGVADGQLEETYAVFANQLEYDAIYDLSLDNRTPDESLNDVLSIMSKAAAALNKEWSLGDEDWFFEAINNLCGND
jgi:energy-coupling factor transporter ATP-binding protein EcfA2